MPFGIPGVFPWTNQSPALLAGVLLGLVVYVGLAVWVYQFTRTRLEVERLEAITDEAHQFFSPNTWRRLQEGAFWLTIGVTAYVFLFASTWVWEPLHDLAFAPALRLAPSILLLGGLLLGSVILIDTIHQAMRFLRGEAHRKPPRELNPQVIHVLELFLKYLTYLVAGAGALVTVLIAAGFQDRIVAGLTDWFTEQAGAILLLAFLGLVGWAGGQIIRAVTQDLRHNTKRLSPRMVDGLGTASRIGLYAVLGLIGTITILSSLGLGQTGQTLIVVTSTFIGLVVAMAATGSIGNALAGFVILSFKPFEQGERVEVHTGVVGDVEKVEVMFTFVRTVDGVLVKVPNNHVLAHAIKNLSRSGTHAIIVDLGIGYEVHHDLVRSLATRAAIETDGVVAEPSPKLHAINFGSYAIQYRLFAYTDDPRHLPIRSRLLGNLQTTFYEAGVEIMTPDVYVIREGRKSEQRPLGIVQRPMTTGPPGDVEPPGA